MEDDRPFRKPLIAIDYDNMNEDDITALAQARAIRPMLKKRQKIARPENYLRPLELADEAQADYTLPYMSFMAFPPEVRTQIYEELLTIKTNENGCWPAIVQLSGVHREAKSVLYGDNEIVVKIKPEDVFALGSRCGPYVPSRTINENPFATPLDFGHLWNFETVGLWCPSGLALAQWVTFIIELDSIPKFQVPGSHALVVNQALYGLCSFLVFNRDLRKVAVVLDDQAAAYERSPDRSLYNRTFDPLQLLGSLPELTFTHAGQDVSKYQSVFWEGLTPLSGTVLRRATPTIKEALDFASAQQLARQSHAMSAACLGYNTVSTTEKARLSQLFLDIPNNRMERLRDFLLKEVWRDSAWEWELEHHVTAISSMLDGLNVDEIRQHRICGEPACPIKAMPDGNVIVVGDPDEHEAARHYNCWDFEICKERMRGHRLRRREEDAARVMRQLTLPD